MDNARQRGTMIRLARVAAGLSQCELGILLNCGQSTVSRLERGLGRANDLQVLNLVALHLGIPPDALGITGGKTSPTLENRVVIENMHRRGFLQGLAGGAVGLALPHGSRTIGPDTVVEFRRELGELYQTDQVSGSACMQAAARRLMGSVRTLLRTATYSPSVGRDLRAVHAAATEGAGWAAYEAGMQDDALRWWRQALRDTDTGDLDESRTIVLASMSLQAADQHRGADAVALARAARGNRGLTPRVMSLLSAREAVGHAVSGKQSEARQAFHVAESLVDVRDDDDPSWIGFWGEADLAGHMSRAALALGDEVAAEAAARRGVAATDAAQWTRNVMLYRQRLGQVLVRRGAVDEAVEVLRPVVASVGDLSSGRLVRNLQLTVKAVGRRAPEFTQWATPLLASA